MSGGKVVSFKDKYTPMEIMRRVPWDKIQKCIVVYEDEEGVSVLNVSEMKWKDRLWLTAAVVEYNTAEAAVNLIQVDE